MKHALTFAALAVSFFATQASALELENVRALFPRALAAQQCPAGSQPAYVTMAYQGMTGQAICAANQNGPKSCVAAKFVAIRADNTYSVWPAYDVSCSTPVVGAWPWGRMQLAPDVLDTQWMHPDMHVICCQ
ncbi:hypothetical protein [Corallococcus sp. Z5C101001]|uniref:hypothetical protein n=1 Tax=Corallococcus sp. Z5C101001 TaxID=2596829 RepID=UPI001180CEC4|nr:hypothetical protein [Corallococcus sp. Z5C101001]TSC33941.1 hypothetical protein FOF48_02520 [Corallococcus sp. Z5C101001]